MNSNNKYRTDPSSCKTFHYINEEKNWEYLMKKEKKHYLLSSVVISYNSSSDYLEGNI